IACRGFFGIPDGNPFYEKRKTSPMCETIDTNFKKRTPMHVKVCGLKHPENMTAIDKLNPDFIGMIFHPASLRFVGGGIFPKTRAKKVGVFVDSPVHYMDRQSKKHDLDYLQLHGNEPLSVVKELADKGFRLIKTFSVS